MFISGCKNRKRQRGQHIVGAARRARSRARRSRPEGSEIVVKRGRSREKVLISQKLGGCWKRFVEAVPKDLQKRSRDASVFVGTKEKSRVLKEPE